MVSVPKLWPGDTVAILATGPSLCVEDCDYLRGKCRVIAINDAHLLAPWADVLYSSDRQWWPHHKGVPSFHGMKYGITGQRRRIELFKGLPEIQILAHTGTSGLELKPHALRTGSNSGYAAINLAVHFGAARILLLGYNMGPHKGKKHFFGDHVGLTNGSNYQGFIRQFETLVKPLQALGIEVINCTHPTRLGVFKQAKLRDVLKAADEVAA